MFAIAKDTTAADILKVQKQTGLFIKSPARKAKEGFSVSVNADDGFVLILFEDALTVEENPLLSRSLSPEELEAIAREYAEEESASSLAYSLLPA